MVSEKFSFHFFFPALFLFFLTQGSVAWALCLGNTSGGVSLKVSHCRQIEPKDHFSRKGSVPLGFYDLYPTEKIVEAFKTYRGYLVVGEVHSSEAFDPVLSDKRALLGQKVTVFIDASEDARCEDLTGQNIWEGEIAQVCCDDSIQAPCLLDTSYTLNQVRPKNSNKEASQVKRNAFRETVKLTREIELARSAFRKEQPGKAVSLYEVAQASGQNFELLDHYILGLSYYLNDGSQCGKGTAHLEKVHDVIREIPGPQLEAYMKRSQLLLARCHSLDGNVDRAVMLLREMLSEPEPFRDQIEIALHHEDFGWINSTSQYKLFLKEALKSI